MCSNSTLNVSFLIWFDGQIVNSPRGVEYHGGCRVEMPLSERMNFDKLVNICKRAVCSGPNSTNSEVEITQILFRLPKFVRGEVDSYALFLVQDNNHLFGILTESMRCPNLRIMEFYVEYRILGGTEISLDNLELSDSSESEWDNESVRSSDEDEDEHFYESDEDDAGDIDAELGMANSGEQTHYQSQLPEHVSRVNVDDFVVDLNEGETPNFTWQPGMEFQTGMTFKSRDVVQICATAYSIAMGKEHQFHRTTPKTIVFVCRHNEICGWWLRATKLQTNHTWTLTKYIGPHTCDHFMTGRDHRNFKSSQIVEFIKDLVLEQRDIHIKTLMAGILERFSVMPTYKRTWLAKEKAICSAYGNWKDSFAEVCSFMANVKVTNPGSFWHAEGDPIYTNHSQNPRVRMFRRILVTVYCILSQRDLQERTHVTGEASSSAARRIRFGARSSQLATMEDRRDVTLPPPEPADQPYQLPPLPPCQVDLSSIRGRRRQPRRMPPQPRPEHVYPIPEPLFFHTEVAGTSDIPQADYWERQHYGSTSGATPQASYPQFQVPPASMPYVDSFFGDTTFTTTQDPPGPSESQVPPAPMPYSDSSFRHTTFANTRDPFAPSDSQVRQPPIPSFHSYLGEMG
ncbi:uncharacterized protein LOC126673309 [Mercurialis annua]|uniref:uncharacterized protein LOC126673309 n=1 Tax=Mercurialis annua TaxID=3986 RepID=UPI00215EA90E|nr:uncharacterized protein LOC126673309 [Mercurialis annua]